ncbi:ABC transporter substrate-binding protein [Piscinibacter sp.]|uniref:ABC transporter substrate-binding protein n=1 Tax=Piscinibacter sp. TaxID=1903157 RepID=UPI0039E3B5C3
MRPASSIRRACLRGAAGAALLAAARLASAAPAKRARLVLAGPSAAISNPLVRMAEAGMLADLADEVKFVAWKDPDQLRLLALEGQADLLAMPSNVAANLYNRGVDLRLLGVPSWGVLWMVSRDAALKTLADFKGKEIVMPFRGDMPDIVLRLLAEKQGLQQGRDYSLRYAASPLDAMQLLVMRRADHALLAEPAVSMALRKTRSFPLGMVAPELHRSVDMQREWGRVMQRAPRMPQAVLTLLGPVAADAALVERLQRDYAAALRWCQGAPAECGRLVASRIAQLAPEAVADAIAVDNARFVAPAEARGELEFFYGQLLARQPGLVGGRLPDARFYGG